MDDHSWIPHGYYLDRDGPIWVLRRADGMGIVFFRAGQVTERAVFESIAKNEEWSEYIEKRIREVFDQ